MSNNTVLNTMTGGDVIQTVDNTTFKTPVTVLANSTGTNFASVNADLTLSVSTPDASFSQTLTTAGQGSSLPTSGASSASVQVTGTWAGTIVFEGSIDGSNFFSLNAQVPTTGALVTSSTANGNWTVDVASIVLFRVRHSIHTSGSVVVTINIGVGTALVGLDTPLPAGANTIGTVLTSGVGAAAATIAGNPNRIGGTARTANPTAVTDGQTSNVMTDKMGRTVVVQGHVRDMVATQATTITSSITATTIVAAAGASTFADITHIDVTNGSATATSVTISDGTKLYVYNVPAGGGFVIDFTTPLPATTANTAWTLTCGVSVASVYCNVVYVKNL